MTQKINNSNRGYVFFIKEFKESTNSYPSTPYCGVDSKRIRYTDLDKITSSYLSNK